MLPQNGTAHCVGFRLETRCACNLMSFCECLDSYHLVTVFTNCGNIPIRVSLQCLIDLHSSHTSGLIVITGCTYGG